MQEPSRGRACRDVEMSSVNDEEGGTTARVVACSDPYHLEPGHMPPASSVVNCAAEHLTTVAKVYRDADAPAHSRDVAGINSRGDEMHRHVSIVSDSFLEL